MRARTVLVGGMVVLAQLPVGLAPRAEAISPGSSVCVEVPFAASGDVAVVNITNTGAVGEGWGALRRSDDDPVPTRSAENQFASVNFAAGTPPNPNLSMATVGTDSRVCYDGAVASHEVILDHFSTIRNSAIDASEPQRIVDSRGAARLASGDSRCVAVPRADEGDLAVINITNTQAAGAGYGALRSSDAQPLADRTDDDLYASVNFAAGTPPNPNLGLALVGSDNRVCYDGVGASHHVILDHLGNIDGARVDHSEPLRLFDSRDSGRLGVWDEVCFAVPGAELEDLAFINITNVGAAGVGYGVLRNAFQAPPQGQSGSSLTASVNFAPGTPPNPNLGVVSVGRDGVACYNGSDIGHHVVLDLFAVVDQSAVRSGASTRLVDTRPPVGPVCSDAAISDDLGARYAIEDGLCENGWAYVEFVSDEPSGDSQLIVRFSDGRWRVYTGFPTFLCRARVLADGAPVRIVDRVLWVC